MKPTYFLDSNDVSIPRQKRGKTLEDRYPGLATIVEITETGDTYDVVRINKNQITGWIPYSYEDVSKDDIGTLITHFESEI